MPASSPTSTPDVQADTQDLFALLGSLPDPRRTGWRRHPLGYVLAVSLSAFTLPGFSSLAGVAQWAAERTQRQLRRLGGHPDPFTGRIAPPCEATIRRVLTGLNPEALTVACAAWTLARRRADDQPAEAARCDAQLAATVTAIAIDGKTARGSGTADRRAAHLLSAVTHDQPMVLAQRQIGDKTNEIPCVQTILADLADRGCDLARTVLTLDALHTQRDTATKIVAADAHYLMTIKANQPRLLAACAAACAAAAPDDDDDDDDDNDDDDDDASEDIQVDRGHGRTEQRILRTVPADGIDFPGAAQLFRVIRYTGGLDGQRATKEVAYGLTSLTAEQADAGRLAELVRGHWKIENAVHWIRDVTFGEDASQARTGNLPAVLATIRNTVIAALRLAGAANIAQARRWATAQTHRVIRLFTANTKLDISSL